jgi:basic amino acid/polyamine antiporter, APA family
VPLRRALGLASLTFYGVGIILGAGIYSVIGVAAGRTGETIWLSFVISSIVALVTALSYAELATTFPETSAEFAYLRRAIPRWPGIAIVTGLLVALSGAATASTVAIAFAGYLRTFIDIPSPLLAYGLLGAAMAINLVGIKESAWINTAFTLVEAGGLLLFIGLGTGSDRFAAALAATPSSSVFSGAALVFFSFLGFENIANLAEEAKDPRRDISRAIFLSLAIATGLYILVALAAVALAPAEQLGQTQAPLVDAARTRSATVAGALGGIALFATANTALVSMLVASRVVFGMARDGALPKALASILPHRKTPWAATVAVAGTSTALVPFGRVGVVASLSSFASLLAFAAVNVALIILRYREPGERRPFRVAGAIGRFPVLPAIGAAATIGIATQLEATALLGGTVALAMFAGYSLWRRFLSRLPSKPAANS